MKKFLFTMGCAALVLASCTDDATTDNPTVMPEPEVNEYVGKMELFDGASQAGRVHIVPATRGLKSERLQLVATVDAPKEREDLNWSATSIYFDDEKSWIYVTWHSNMQAKYPTANTELWGGAFDMFSINVHGVEDEDGGDYLGDFTLEPWVTGIAESMKFEHVMIDKTHERAFLSGTQSKGGGAVARVDLSDFVSGKKDEEAKFEIIGFPGSSVNAVAQQENGDLIAISGYTGTYGTFEPDIEAGPYKDENGTLRTDIKTPRPVDKTFGGKYVTSDGKYLLRDSEEGAKIIDVEDTGNQYSLGYRLLSSVKSAEKYEVDENGKVLDWEIVEGTEAQKYGKHVLVVKGNYAYVAAGGNGLRVHNLDEDGEEVRWQDQSTAKESEKNNGPSTTGLFADDDFLYAATGSGLRVYKFKDDGGLELYAFEVENYDEETGLAKPDDEGKFNAAETETAERHSCNFVVARTSGNTDWKYIYVAYGKSGIRIYKFNPNPEVASDGE